MGHYHSGHLWRKCSLPARSYSKATFLVASKASIPRLLRPCHSACTFLKLRAHSHLGWRHACHWFCKGWSLISLILNKVAVLNCLQFLPLHLCWEIDTFDRGPWLRRSSSRPFDTSTSESYQCCAFESASCQRFNCTRSLCRREDSYVGTWGSGICEHWCGFALCR